jgi:hypothetical protein
LEGWELEGVAAAERLRSSGDGAVPGRRDFAAVVAGAGVRLGEVDGGSGVLRLIVVDLAVLAV